MGKCENFITKQLQFVVGCGKIYTTAVALPWRLNKEEGYLDLFYCDILSYDDEGAEEYCSKEVYVKRVKRYFSELPGKTTAAELIRAVYSASVDKEKMGVVNPTIVLGYVKSTGEAVLFTGELDRIQVELTPRDKVILFSSH